MQGGSGHDKRNYRVDPEGRVAYQEQGAQGMEPATLQQRTALGKHRDGSIYLRASDSEDLGAIKAAADSMNVPYRQRRAGATHYGRRGSFEHLHFDRPADALKVHAVLGYHLHTGDGAVEGVDAHLDRMERAVGQHVRGKDHGIDGAVTASRAALSRSRGAQAAGSPEAHAHAAELHRAAREGHQVQAARPWAGNEAVLHAGLGILHHRMAEHHELAARKAQARIDAAKRRAAELQARMEAAEEGREAQKSLSTVGAGTDLSTLQGGGALRAENHDEALADGTIGDEAPRELEKAVELPPLPEPTEAQREAGNYQKHHLTLHGLGVSIENPVGSTRRGVDRDGTPWETTMAHHYGYLKRTQGADGDHVDCFIGPEPENPYVHVINQVEPMTGRFDEHKVMLGFPSREAAVDAYHANYATGWKGCGDVRTMHVDDFKHWLRNGDTTSRLIYKAVARRLHTAASTFYRASRLRPAMKSVQFTNAVLGARGVGLPAAEITRLVTIATGGDTAAATRLLSTVQ